MGILGFQNGCHWWCEFTRFSLLRAFSRISGTTLAGVIKAEFKTMDNYESLNVVFPPFLLLWNVLLQTSCH